MSLIMNCPNGYHLSAYQVASIIIYTTAFLGWLIALADISLREVKGEFKC